jgi:hypothetical protein
MGKIVFTAVLGLGLFGLAAGASAEKGKKLDEGTKLPPGLIKKIDDLPPGIEKKLGGGKKYSGNGPSVPEPSAALLFGIGSLITAMSLRRQSR